MDARYQPPWPLGLLLPPPTLALYSGVHRLLLRLHWLAHQVQRSRERVRAASKALASSPSPPSPSSRLLLRCAHALLHRLAGLAALLLQHVALQVEGDGWAHLRGLLARLQDDDEEEDDDDEVITVDGLRAAHAAYVAQVAAQCYVTGAAAVQREVELTVAFIAGACSTLEDGAMALLLRLLNHRPTAAATRRAGMMMEEERALASGLRKARSGLQVRVARLAQGVRRRRLQERTAAAAATAVGGGGGGEYADALVVGLEDVLAAESAGAV